MIIFWGRGKMNPDVDVMLLLYNPGDNDIYSRHINF